MKYIVGTRGSKLALTQTGWVVEQMCGYFPEDIFEIKIIETKGDLVQDVPLDKVGGSGIFVKELERALLNKSVDFAVHSLKDMPSQMADGLCLAAFPKREDPLDVLLTTHPIDTIDGLPQNPVIGTGSLRRRHQFAQLRQDALFEPIRGNIDTRIMKLKAGLDGIILAQAGINRLKPDLDGVRAIRLSAAQMLPAPCQGILGLQAREADRELIQKLKRLDDPQTAMQALEERAFLKSAMGNCHIPIGCCCMPVEDGLQLEGILGHNDGLDLIRRVITGKSDGNLGEKLGLSMMQEVGL